MRHVLFICATWLIHMCVLFICATWLIHMCVLFICATWLIHICDMSYSYVWHDSFKCVYVQNGSFMCTTWLFLPSLSARNKNRKKKNPHSHVMHDSYVRLDSRTLFFNLFKYDAAFTCATWLIHVCAWWKSLLLQYIATHCNTLQRTATHRNALQHTATQCVTLQHTTTHYNTLQRA